MPLKQDRACDGVQAGRGRPEKLASSRWPQPVAKADPRCEVYRWHRGRHARCSNRCRLTRSSPRFGVSSPPAYVKPYVKQQKNDATDAEAICEAVARADMRFVPAKTPEQQGGLVLHRT